MSDEVMEVVGFKLPQNKIVSILTHLQGAGTTLVGENVKLADDCIIRVTSKGIWSVTVDGGRKLIMQAKIIKSKSKDLETVGKGNIPINIEKFLRFIARFATNDKVEVLYENGMIVFRKTEDTLDYPVTMEIFMTTKRFTSIRHDFINNLKTKISKGGMDKDKAIMNFFKKYRSIYSLDDDKNIALVLNDTKLDNWVEVACNQLKEVVKDGELLENRIYPFEVTENKLNITARSIKKEIQDRISRDIYLKKANLVGKFKTAYSSQFNAAVSSTRGHIFLYFGNNKPLLLIKSTGVEDGISMVYIVMPYRQKK